MILIIQNIILTFTVLTGREEVVPGSLVDLHNICISFIQFYYFHSDLSYHDWEYKYLACILFYFNIFLIFQTPRTVSFYSSL